MAHVAALLFLSVIPTRLVGAFRLTQLAGGAEIMPARRTVLCVTTAGGAAYPERQRVCHLGCVPVRNRFPAAQAGLAPRGWAAPGSMRTAGWAFRAVDDPVLSPPAGDGELLYAFRLLFGSAMVVSIVLGFTAILRGDVIRHRAWMMRGYAIGLGAGTQMLTLLAGELIIGPPSELSRALLMGAAWVINLAVAEWAIRKRPAPLARKAPVGATH